MLHKVRTALSFLPHDWWILAQAWFLLLVVDLGLRLLPFQHVLQGLGPTRLVRADSQPADGASTIRKFNQLVKIAARNHLYEMTCLRQALVLRHLLYLNGVETRLVIGAQRETGKLNAHAWVEYQGVPVGSTNGMQALCSLRN